MTRLAFPSTETPAKLEEAQLPTELVLPSAVGRSEVLKNIGRSFPALGLLLVGGLLGCPGTGEPESEEEPVKLTVTPEIMAAQERLTEQVLTLPGVVGTAIGEFGGELCIKVMVVRKTDELAQKIPPKFEGHAVIIQETGVIRKRGN